MSADRGHEYFFEMLLEEIPAWMLPHPGLQPKLPEIYAELGVEAAEGMIVADATPRRLFFRLAGLPLRQRDRTEQVKGPPKKIAFDADGKPAPALAGFLKKNASSVDDLVERGDEYVWLERSVRGRTTAEIVSERVPQIIESLRWPKMMRWADGAFAFIRPVHSVVSLLDGEVVPVTIFGVGAGRTTVGHRIISDREIEVTSFDDYVGKLREANVYARTEERVEAMRRRSEELAAEVGGVPATDASIWEQWKYLTECPGVVRASFDERFLALPSEVLITVMRVHQKQLPVYRDEALTSSFLAVMDIDSDREGNVSSGNSFVTNARFADALFFYDTDRKRKLVDRVGDLAQLQFQEKLGNYLEKTHRIASIAEQIRAEGAPGVTPDEVQTAAELSKVDLQTEMVKEFTELQGKIGGIYAREEGQREPVWHAIYDHYLPVSTDDPLPRGAVGAVVSLADRFDTLAGFFLIGVKPTGSKDPFALRRAAQGAVQILLSEEPWKIAIGVDRIIDFALGGFALPGTNAVAARSELLEFIGERVRTLLESIGFAYDEVAAAMAPGWANSLTDLRDRAAAVRRLREDAGFLSILDSAKRIENITAGFADTTIDRKLLAEPQEQRLAELADLVGEQIDELVAQRQYVAALQSFAGLAPELEKFFDEVMVMVEDEAVRRNRMALLRRVGTAVRKIADVTKIVVARREYDARR